ncbi:hypothetical protein WKI71_36595 [Streptomyces sp. MS1.AVA.1]|uniref:Uncharacterized protein n=1 Tax=Streptomyces machairae TaxID=3134109 RepID=A0ABU8USK5_9ACTN
MQVITVTDDGTLRIEFTADEAAQIREDIETNWTHATDAGKELVRYVDTLYGEQRPRHHRPTFPGGGF